MNRIPIKINYNETLRKINVSPTTTFQELFSQISQLLNLRTFKIYYLDDDREWILFDTDLELKSLLSEQQSIRVKVVKKTLPHSESDVWIPSNEFISTTSASSVLTSETDSRVPINDVDPFEPSVSATCSSEQRQCQNLQEQSSNSQFSKRDNDAISMYSIDSLPSTRPTLVAQNPRSLTDIADREIERLTDYLKVLFAASPDSVPKFVANLESTFSSIGRDVQSVATSLGRDVQNVATTIGRDVQQMATQSCSSASQIVNTSAKTINKVNACAGAKVSKMAQKVQNACASDFAVLLEEIKKVTDRINNNVQSMQIPMNRMENEHKFEKEMEFLVAMRFENRQLNQELLESTNGDLGKVVDILTF